MWATWFLAGCLSLQDVALEKLREKACAAFPELGAAGMLAMMARE